MILESVRVGRMIEHYKAVQAAHGMIDRHVEAPSLPADEQRAIDKARAKALAQIEAEAERHGRFMARAFKRPERTKSKKFIRTFRGALRGGIGADRRKGLVKVD